MWATRITEEPPNPKGCLCSTNKSGQITYCFILLYLYLYLYVRCSWIDCIVWLCIWLHSIDVQYTIDHCIVLNPKGCIWSTNKSGQITYCNKTFSWFALFGIWLHSNYVQCNTLHCSSLQGMYLWHKQKWTYYILQYTALGYIVFSDIALYSTRSLGTIRAPTSSWRPFGPLDFVLRGSRPSDTQAVWPMRRVSVFV